MFKVLIIDDEPLARQLIRSFLSKHDQYDIVGECGDGFEGYKAIQQLNPDLVFLDVQMPKISGFEMLEMIDNPPSIIFTTAFDHYALKAFETHAIDYLLKPIGAARMDLALLKWEERHPLSSTLVGNNDLVQNYREEQMLHRIVVKENNSIRIIPAADVEYIEAADDYVKIFTKGGYSLKKTTMTKLETSLDGNAFVRVHRSWIIPVSRLQSVSPYEKDGYLATLIGGVQVPVSKTGIAKLREVLNW